MSNVIKKIMGARERYSAGMSILAIIGIVIGVIALEFGAICFQAWLIMLLWNQIVVSLFDVPTLGFWVAFGLCWLFSLLFKK